MVQQGAVSVDAGSADTLVGIALAFVTTLSFNLPPVLLELANKGLPLQNRLTSLDVGCAPILCYAIPTYTMLYTMLYYPRLLYFIPQYYIRSYYAVLSARAHRPPCDDRKYPPLLSAEP